MIGKFFENMRERKLSKALEKLPGVQYGKLAIGKYWTDNYEITKDFRKEFVSEIAGAMMEDVLSISTSPDPRMANRHRLADCMDEFALLQVLVIDPPPERDPTGLRESEGITGELKAHLLELADRNEDLKIFFHSLPSPLDWNMAWDAVLLRYRVVYAWTHVLNVLRMAFDDTNPQPDKDWFRPFLVATCAWHEHQLRKDLGMQPALCQSSDCDPDIEAMLLGTFSNVVKRGSRYPDLDWANPDE